jgi:hypothetical protein
MATAHKVREGEGMSSIAFKYGFFADTLWNLPENAQLKALRKEGEILLPGDVVHIPDKREKIENVPTGDKHKFKLKNIPPDARKGKLSLNDGEEIYDLNFGYNDPVNTVSGVQSRLRNLGFYKGEVDGRAESVAGALKAFQRDQKLEVTGKINAPTIKALESTHGS